MRDIFSTCRGWTFDCRIWLKAILFLLWSQTAPAQSGQGRADTYLKTDWSQWSNGTIINESNWKTQRFSSDVGISPVFKVSKNATFVKEKNYMTITLAANKCCYFENRVRMQYNFKNASEETEEVWAYWSTKIDMKHIGRGGKMPISIHSRNFAKAFSNPTSGKEFTSIFMWHQAGLSKDNSPTGSNPNPEDPTKWEMKTYRYNASGLPGPGSSWVFKDLNTNDRLLLDKDTWYDIIYHLKLNTPGKSDGVAEVWIRENGTVKWKKVQETYTSNFRNKFTNGFARFEIESFPGGNVVSQYAATTDRKIMISDITITSDSIASPKFIPDGEFKAKNTPVNEIPLAVNDNVNTQLETSVSIPVLENDDLGNEPTYIVKVSNTTQGGSAVIRKNGTPTDPTDDFVRYTPPTGFSGLDSFNYTIRDQDGETSSGKVKVTVNPVNDKPLAVDDAASTEEEAPVNIPVLENDDLGNGPTSIINVGKTTQGGSAVIRKNGTPTDPTDDFVRYTPPPEFSGVDSFSYTIRDQDGETSSGKVTVTVNPENDEPLAVDDAASTEQGTAVSIPVLENDDLGNGPTSIINVGKTTQGGSAVIRKNGTPTDPTDDFVRYTPPTGFSGVDSFNYTIRDQDGETSSGKVTVTVNPLNDKPLAVDDAASTEEGASVNIAVLENDRLGNEPTSIINVGNTTHGGSAVIRKNGTPSDATDDFVRYTPPAGFRGVDSFNYTLKDQDGEKSTAKVTVTVNPLNDKPLALDDVASTDEGNPVSIDVLENDDLGNEPTQIINVGNSTQGGSAVIRKNGTPTDPTDDFVRYTPPQEFSGVDSFSYTIRDQDGETSSGKVTVTVNPVNDKPLAVNDSGKTSEETAVSIYVLNNDQLGDTPTSISDVDNSTSKGGVAVINFNGTRGDFSDDFIEYMPPTNFNGVDTFEYTIEDEDGETSTATVFITVTVVNDTPLAVDESESTTEDTMITIDVLANDNLGDVPTSIISVDAISVEGGHVQINQNGTSGDTSDDFIEYIPAHRFTGKDTFTYTIQDKDGEVSSATVTITVKSTTNEIEIYGGFSPNGDGSNDEWVIDGILIYPQNTVQVFSSSGDMVYMEKGYDNQSKVWFGQANRGWMAGNDLLPNGTYFYMVDLGDGSEIRRGYVILKK